VTEGALIIRAMPLIDGGRRIGTRLFLRMPRMCGKRVDTAEESTGFVSLRSVAGRLEDGGIRGSPQRRALHRLRRLCGCLAANFVVSSLLLRLPKLMQLPRMRSNPFSDVSGMCTIAD
jgi:hypothetical protein